MAMSDPLADMLTRIRNGQMARLLEVSSPASKLRANVLNVLKVENSVNSKKSFGGTSKQNVIKMINKTLKELR